MPMISQNLLDFVIPELTDDEANELLALAVGLKTLADAGELPPALAGTEEIIDTLYVEVLLDESDDDEEVEEEEEDEAGDVGEMHFHLHIHLPAESAKPA